MLSTCDARPTRQGVGLSSGSCLEPTREVLPLTPHMIAQLEANEAAARSRAGRRILMSVAAAALVAILFSSVWDPTVVIICCLFALPGLLELIKGMQESFTDDVDSDTFVRLTGPIHLCRLGYDDGSSDFCLSIDGEDFVISHWIFVALQHVDWASVDYAECSRTLFAVRDQSGNVLWQN
jgi:hypothetical protein